MTSDTNKQSLETRTKLFKNPPLVKLLQYLQSIKISDAEIDQIVREYWEAVEKNPSFEKEIADKFKIKYNGKV